MKTVGRGTLMLAANIQAQTLTPTGFHWCCPQMNFSSYLKQTVILEGSLNHSPLIFKGEGMKTDNR